MLCAPVSVQQPALAHVLRLPVPVCGVWPMLVCVWRVLWCAWQVQALGGAGEQGQGQEHQQQIGPAELCVEAVWACCCLCAQYIGSVGNRSGVERGLLYAQTACWEAWGCWLDMAHIETQQVTGWPGLSNLKPYNLGTCD